MSLDNRMEKGQCEWKLQYWLIGPAVVLTREDGSLDVGQWQWGCRNGDSSGR